MSQYIITIKVADEQTQADITTLFNKLIDRLVENGRLEYVESLTIEKRNRGGRPASRMAKVRDWVRAQPKAMTFTVADLAKELGMNRSSAWKAVQKLVEEEVIVKRQNPWDNQHLYSR